jgi:EpsD family peptidyl-prolyl cis-trans isomerase
VNNYLRVPVVLVASALALSACGKKPEGQIVAVVNGEEVSLSDLNQEMRGANIPEGADRKLIQRSMLQRVIDRRLLAQAAKEQGIDRDPEYIAMQRRASQDLLIQMYSRKAASGIKVPDAAALDKFMAENPAMFAQRTQLQLDQIVFDMPKSPEVLKQFQQDKTLAAVAATAQRLGLKVEAGKGGLDTATLPPAVLKQIQALPPGEPFIVPTGKKVVVSVITGKQPVSVPADQMRPAAVEAMRNQEFNKIGEQRLKEVRQRAKIEYQPGYEPPALPKPAATPAK